MKHFLRYCYAASLLMTALLIGCGGGRDLIKTNQTVALSRETQMFNTFVRNVQSERRGIEREIERARDVTTVEDVDRNRFSLRVADRSKVDIDNIRGDKDIVSSALSYDARTLLIKMEGSGRRGRQTVNNESIYLYSLQSGDAIEIYEYEKSPAPYYREIFPSLVWDRFSNMYAFIGEEGGYSEVFVGFHEDENNAMQFNNFKITNNRDREIYYFDLSLSPSGEKLAFTEYSEQDRTFNVRIFSLRNQRWEEHRLGDGAAGFRFCSQRDNGAFFAKETSGLYYPFYTDNYARSSGNILSGAEGIMEPLFIGNFAFHENRLAILSIKDSDFTLTVHCFDNDNYYHGKSNYHDPQLPFIPNYGPVWVKEDNFVIVHNILQRGAIFFSFVNGDFLRNIGDRRISIDRYIEDRNLWDINSITASSNGKSMIFTAYDDNIQERRKNLYHVDIEVNKRIIPPDELMVTYRTNISFSHTNEAGEPVLELRRRRRVRGSDVSPIGSITIRKDFYYHAEQIDEETLIKGGRNIIIAWPSSINERTIEVTAKLKDTEVIVPGERD